MPVQKRKRQYYPQNLEFSGEELLIEAQKINDTAIKSAYEMEIWFLKWSELAMIGYEMLASLYIKYIKNVTDETSRNTFLEFNSKIWGQFELHVNKIAKKYYASPFRKELPPKRYSQLDARISNEIELFSDKNTPFKAKEQELIAKLNSIDARQTFHFQGEAKTYYQLAPFLRDEKLSVREEAWRALYEGFLTQSDVINDIMSELIPIRGEMACNVGAQNYIEFRHRELERFSFSIDDIIRFHQTVEKEVIPLIGALTEINKKEQDLQSWQPWDSRTHTEKMQYIPPGSIDEFVQRSIKAVDSLKPEYGEYLKTLSENNLLDLEQRKGKIPGVSNTNLLEQGTSFISMHLTSRYNDMVSLFHEFGHSLHTRAMKDEDLITYLFPPIEVSELASKSFELFMTAFWKDFFNTSKDRELCKKKLLKQALFSIRSNVICDTFNHWIYSHPKNTAEERMAYYRLLQDRFSNGVDYSGLEKQKSVYWIASHHIIRQPFSEIGYAFAQLGALALYKQFTEDKTKALKNFENFMKLGSSKSVPELYEAAGISFDFSPEYVREIMAFVRDEL